MAKGRRWFRYSLRSLLVLMLLVALFLAWFTPRHERARRQAAAVAALREVEDVANKAAGKSAHTIALPQVSVTYDYQRGSGASGAPPVPSWLRSVLGDDFFADVTAVDLSTRQIDDEDFTHLRDLDGLRELSLSIALDPEYCTASLERIGQLTKLQRLEISGHLSDQGLAHLTGLNDLTTLRLNHFRIPNSPIARSFSAEGLEHLIDLENLRHLELDTVQLDEGMIAALSRLSPTIDIAIQPTKRAQFIDMARRPGQVGRLRVFGSLYATDDLMALTRMRGISELCLDHIRVENASLVAFSTMPWLDTLVFWHAELDGVDLGRLGQTPRLRRIALVGPVKADVIGTLADAKHVSELLYQPGYDTQITPPDVQQALEALATLIQLRHVVLAGEMIHDVDVASLRAALPDAEVSRAEINRLPDVRAAFAAAQQ